jgi:hypothetical protein
MAEAAVRASMYITDADNSPPGSLLGHPTVIVEPPFHLVGEFLTSEVDSSRCPLFDLLPKVLMPRSEYVGGGEGHLLEIRGEVAWLTTLYAEPEVECKVPTTELRDLVMDWRRFVRAFERQSVKNAEPKVADVT